MKSFSGTKSIVISTVSWVGGKNPFLGWAYVAAAALFVLLGLAGTVRHLVKPRYVLSPLPGRCATRFTPHRQLILARHTIDGLETCRSSAGTRASETLPHASPSAFLAQFIRPACLCSPFIICLDSISRQLALLLEPTLPLVRAGFALLLLSTDSYTMGLPRTDLAALMEGPVNPGRQVMDGQRCSRPVEATAGPSPRVDSHRDNWPVTSPRPSPFRLSFSLFSSLASVREVELGSAMTHIGLRPLGRADSTASSTSSSGSSAPPTGLEACTMAELSERLGLHCAKYVSCLKLWRSVGVV